MNLIGTVHSFCYFKWRGRRCKIQGTETATPLSTPGNIFATPWTVARLCPRNFPGKNTRVGSHFRLQRSSRPRDPICTGGLLCLPCWLVDSLPPGKPTATAIQPSNCTQEHLPQINEGSHACARTHTHTYTHLLYHDQFVIDPN